MTFLELAQRLRQEIGYAGSGPDSVVDQTGEAKVVVDWVNSAYKDVQNKWTDWRFLWAEETVELIAGQRDYDWPEDCSMLHETSFYLNGELLEYVPWDEYRSSRDSFDDQTGTPTQFTYTPSEKIRVFPTPTAADAGDEINFEYQIGNQELVEDEDEPLVPPRYHDTILWRARWYWAIFDEATASIQMTALMYAEALKRLESTQLPSKNMQQARAMGADIVVRTE